MVFKVLAVVALFVAVVCEAKPQYNLPTPPPAPVYGAPDAGADEPAKYDFNWAVQDDESGNDFGHEESRDGDFTEGSYYVQLPDGRLQKVTYTVDGDSGYVAEVTYEGEAQYPEAAASSGYPQPAPAPAYAPPSNLYQRP